MDNIIPTRIYDFLRQYPPFSLLEKADLMTISEKTVVQYCQPQEVIFQQDQTPLPLVFIVREGAVHLYQEDEDSKTLIDVCDEGDVFGLRPLLADQSYALTAIAEEETLLYGIKVSVLQPILENRPKVALYLAQSFAAGARPRSEEENKGRIFFQRELPEDETYKLVEIQSVDHSKAPGNLHLKGVTVQEAARVMANRRVGSISNRQ